MPASGLESPRGQLPGCLGLPSRVPAPRAKQNLGTEKRESRARASSLTCAVKDSH